YLGNPALTAVALTIGLMGALAVLPTFWTLPTGFLTGSAAAGGIALINSIGNLGGFVGPYALGWIKDATGEIKLGLVALAACPIMAGIVRHRHISDGPRLENTAKRTAFFADLLTLTSYVVFPSWQVFFESITTFTIPPELLKTQKIERFSAKSILLELL